MAGELMNGFKWWWLFGLPFLPLVLIAFMIDGAVQFGDWLRLWKWHQRYGGGS